MDEQEHSAGPEPQSPSVTSPGEAPAAGQPERPRRGETIRKALISRGAGWVVAAALAGAVVALSVVLATASPTTVVLPVGAARPALLGPAGAGPARQEVPGGLPAPPHLRVEVPGGLLVPACVPMGIPYGWTSP